LINNYQQKRFIYALFSSTILVKNANKFEIPNVERNCSIYATTTLFFVVVLSVFHLGMVFSQRHAVLHHKSFDVGSSLLVSMI